jgi:uroporphyrinogen III methyltransferase/synthase
MMARGAEWVTFTSGSTVEQFHARFDLPEFLRRHPGVRTASLGPETTAALRVLSVTPAVEAAPHTMDGLIKAMERAPAR